MIATTFLSGGQRVLVVGAGSAGEMLVRDMLRDPVHAYLPVAFVDDLPRRQGGEIQGIPVVGTCERIPELALQHDIEVVVLAVPSADSRQMRRLVELCESANIPFRTGPKLHSLMRGQVSVDQLRAVSIEDLLGRQFLRSLRRCADLDALFQRRNANLEKLVEIRTGDAQETQPLQQRNARVQRLCQHALVELEHAEIAIDIEFSRWQRRCVHVLVSNWRPTSITTTGCRFVTQRSFQSGV